jgi:hypothetical protein
MAHEIPVPHQKTYKDFPFVRELHEALTALRGGGFCGMIIAGLILTEVPTAMFESVSDLLRRPVPGRLTGYGAWIDYAPVLIPYAVLVCLTLRHYWKRIFAKGSHDILVGVALIVLCVIPTKRLFEVRARTEDATKAANALAKQINEAVENGVSIREKVLEGRVAELSRQVDILKGVRRVQGFQGMAEP